MDALWPAQIPQAKKAKPVRAKIKRLPPPTMRPDEWFTLAWSLLDGPTIRHSIRDIQKLVCAHFNVPHLYMETSRRNHAHYLPRAVAIFLCREFTTQSCPAIGRMFGNRDHTTILSCIKSVEKMIALRHPIARDIEILSSKLRGPKHD